MIYNMTNTADVGKFVVRVVDANGLEYKYTMEIDTETGRIVKQKRDNLDRPVIDEYEGCVVLETVQAAPPVSVTFQENK